MIRYIRVRPFEIGLVLRDGTFRGLLGPGAYWRFDPLGRERIDIVSQRTPWLVHEQLDLIVRSGTVGDDAVVLDLRDHERGLVWIDGRFAAVLPPGLYALWTTFRRVRAEVVDLCPGCAANMINLSRAAFSVVADTEPGSARVRYWPLDNPPLPGATKYPMNAPVVPLNRSTSLGCPT